MSTFNAGQSVYYSQATNKVLVLKSTEKSNSTRPLKVELGVYSNLPLTFFSDGRHSEQSVSPIIFHATQENYELLSKLYPNVTFEPPPKRKEPKEIIQSMLDDGWDCVPVIYLENGTKCMGYAKYSYLTMTATPFDPKTGKTIIDFVDGEVVLESENE